MRVSLSPLCVCSLYVAVYTVRIRSYGHGSMGAERSAGHAVHIKGELLLDMYIYLKIEKVKKKARRPDARWRSLARHRLYPLCPPIINRNFFLLILLSGYNGRLIRLIPSTLYRPAKPSCNILKESGNVWESYRSGLTSYYCRPLYIWMTSFLLRPLSRRRRGPLFVANTWTFLDGRRRNFETISSNKREEKYKSRSNAFRRWNNGK